MTSLPEPYFSKNGWIAQVDHDTCVVNPMLHGKGKFLVVGWNVLGQKCALQKVFDTPELAQKWILSLDPQTRSLETEFGKATVFINLDGQYWWSEEVENNFNYHQLYITYGMEHAVKLVESALYSLSPKNLTVF